jgi:ABC-type Na+ efflux pump permease subunit
MNTVGINSEVLINGIMSEYKEFLRERTTRSAILHISSPWRKPAIALISNVNMISITNLTQVISSETSQIETSIELVENEYEIEPSTTVSKYESEIEQEIELLTASVQDGEIIMGNDESLTTSRENETLTNASLQLTQMVNLNLIQNLLLRMKMITNPRLK